MDEGALRSVLIVDDSDDFSALLTLHLNRAYPDVTVERFNPSKNGRPSGEFQWARFDLLILDYEWGNGDTGLEWLRAYRDIADFPPTIVMTAHGDEELAVSIMKNGAQHPCDKRKLNHARVVKVISDVLFECRDRLTRNARIDGQHFVFDKALFYRSLQEAMAGGLCDTQVTMALISVDQLDNIRQESGLLEVDTMVAQLCELAANALSDPQWVVNVTRVGDGAVAVLVCGSIQPGREEMIGARLSAALAAEPNAPRGDLMQRRASVGVVPLDKTCCSQPSNALLAQADVAVRLARQSPNHGVFVRRPEFASTAAQGPSDKLDLRDMIERNLLETRVQPIAAVSEAASAFYQCRVGVVATHDTTLPVLDLLVDPDTCDGSTDGWSVTVLDV